VIAATRAVGVKVGRFYAVVREVFSGWAVELDGACGRDVVGGDGVAEDGENAGAGDFVTGAGCAGMPSKYGAYADVGGVRRLH